MLFVCSFFTLRRHATAAQPDPRIWILPSLSVNTLEIEELDPRHTWAKNIVKSKSAWHLHVRNFVRARNRIFVRARNFRTRRSFVRWQSFVRVRTFVRGRRAWPETYLSKNFVKSKFARYIWWHGPLFCRKSSQQEIASAFLFSPAKNLLAGNVLHRFAFRTNVYLG